MKNIKIVEMNDDFECKCGNVAAADGFYPCNKEGENVEPFPGWEGHYKCEKCDQIYLPK